MRSEAGKGPGDGDRFLYLQDVLALWSNINGQVGLTVLGYNGVGAWSGDALSADLQALRFRRHGGERCSTRKRSNCCSTSIPITWCARSRSNLGPPLLGPPRFTPLDPLNANGTGTAATGDVISLAIETITDMSTTNASKTINVTDAKPGWIDVLMGADNVETNTTVQRPPTRRRTSRRPTEGRSPTPSRW